MPAWTSAAWIMVRRRVVLWCGGRSTALRVACRHYKLIEAGEHETAKSLLGF
jgi:hypothetical protein